MVVVVVVVAVVVELSEVDELRRLRLQRIQMAVGVHGCEITGRHFRSPPLPLVSARRSGGE